MIGKNRFGLVVLTAFATSKREELRSFLFNDLLGEYLGLKEKGVDNYQYAIDEWTIVRPRIPEKVYRVNA
jgi:hypothetical protein